MSHRALVMAAAGALILTGAAAAAPDRASSTESVAAPALIIVHGPGLAREVRLSELEENHRFVAGLVSLEVLEKHPLVRRMAARDLVSLDTAGRAMLNVALFIRVDSSLARVPTERWPAERAQMHARFYPATERDGALWLYANPSTGEAWGPRRPSDEAVAILARHGVPVRMERAGAM